MLCNSAAALIFMLACASLQAAEPRCPSNGNKHPLVAASVFDGPPEELADLIPDTSRKNRSGTTSTWDVDYIFEAGRQVFLVCKYAGSAEAVTVRIEEKVRKCTYRSPVHRPPELVCQ